jgi:hypothetical protein
LVNTSIDKAAANKKSKNRPPIHQKTPKSVKIRPKTAKTLTTPKTPQPHNHHLPPQTHHFTNIQRQKPTPDATQTTNI